MTKRTTALVNLTIAATSVLLLAFVAEFLLVMVVPVFYRPRVTRIDTTLGWTHRPSVSVTGDLEGHHHRVTYNRHGYRVPEHTFSNPEGRPRVVVLGDSFVDGAEVGDKELHTVLLQKETSAEIINLGVYSYSTAQELLTLETAGARYGPDLVVMVTVSNDFIDNTRNFSHYGPVPRFRLDADSLLFEATTGSEARDAFRATNMPAPLMAFLHRRSTLYYVLNRFIYRRLSAARIAAVLKAQDDAVTPAERAELYRRIVRRTKAASERIGADFLVVFAHKRDEVFEERSPFESLARGFAQEGIDAVDLFEGLRAAEESSSESLWYREDIHWNARGHRVVADLLRPHLEERLKRRESSH